jgi:serine/threonine-protein kinase 24/25/MST4
MRYLSANQFEVYEQIGKGGFGVVYRGLDRVTKKPVAIKEIDLESTDNLDDLQREIGILSQCHLDQITRYHGCFVKGYKLWIVMEYLDGGSCSDLLRPGPLKEKYIAILLRELLLALSYLHEKGRIHRDIKAANILLNTKGNVKIADFGVSTQLSSNLSRRHTFVGSPYWMSPEVILEEDYDFKADIWSLGITAIELATGKPPLSEIPPMKVLFQIPENHPPQLAGNQWSTDFKEFISMCLQKNPKERPSARRLLKSRFISYAGRNSALRELVKRKQVWDLQNEEPKREVKYYVSTVGSDEDKENCISFDFKDSVVDKSVDPSADLSEVVITNTSPLRYGFSLDENANLQNLSFADQSTVKHTSQKADSRPSSSDVRSAFNSSLELLNLQDDVQRVKLQQIGFLLQELDENVLSQFCMDFTSKLQKSLPRVVARRNTTTQSKENRPRGPRKADSEKLLLKRWADQYFS